MDIDISKIKKKIEVLKIEKGVLEENLNREKEMLEEAENKVKAIFGTTDRVKLSKKKKELQEELEKKLAEVEEKYPEIWVD